MQQHTSAQMPPTGRRPMSTEVDAKIVVRETGEHVYVLPPAAEPAIAWVAAGEATVEMRPGNGMARTATLRQGDFYLSVACMPTEVRWRNHAATPLTVLYVKIGLPLLLHVVRDIIGAAPVGYLLRDALGEKDGVLSGLLDLVYRSLQGRSPACNGFMQGMSQALAAHVVHHYRHAGPQSVSVSGGLPPYKLQRVFKAMRDGLAEPFDLERLANIAALSVFHFSRAFKRSTGTSPSRYFVNLRIEEAKRMLCDTPHGVIDVAFALGYRSPSHFSQVFRELTGVSPSVYRGRQ